MKKITTNLITNVKDAIDILYNTVTSISQNSDYEIKGDINQIANISVNDIQKLKHEHVRKFKRLKRYLNKFLGKPTLGSINVLLWVLNHCSLISNTIKIIEPKHEEIQKLKQEYLIKKAYYDKSFAQYRKLKSDYYKTKKGLVI